ncbi:hypothetical protein BgiBS90_009085 [Biomphalaria glabrata]|nr:hypothetical protein BgiBS90_009085 [Biomphalaria glabrata]
MWSCHCRGGLVIVEVVLSLSRWSCHCRGGLVIVEVVLSLSRWSCHCRDGLVIVEVVLSLSRWSCHCRGGLVIVEVVLSLSRWSCHCRDGLVSDEGWCLNSGLGFPECLLKVTVSVWRFVISVRTVDTSADHLTFDVTWQVMSKLYNN